MLAIRVSFSAPGTVDSRARYLDDHKTYLRTAKIRIVQSGPVLNEEGNSVGGMVVADVASLEEMQAFSAGDPFVIHGVYGATNIFEWRVSIDNRI
jgi:uncharacterized protein